MILRYDWIAANNSNHRNIFLYVCSRSLTVFNIFLYRRGWSYEVPSSTAAVLLHLSKIVFTNTTRHYTGMRLECYWLTQCTLGYRWATQSILVGYAGTPLEILSWNCPHWNATRETFTNLAYTGTTLEKLSWNCPTLKCYWRNSDHCSLHRNTTGRTITARTHTDTYS